MAKCLFFPNGSAVFFYWHPLPVTQCVPLVPEHFARPLWSRAIFSSFTFVLPFALAGVAVAACAVAATATVATAIDASAAAIAAAASVAPCHLGFRLVPCPFFVLPRFPWAPALQRAC